MERKLIKARLNKNFLTNTKLENILTKLEEEIKCNKSELPLQIARKYSKILKHALSSPIDYFVRDVSDKTYYFLRYSGLDTIGDLLLRSEEEVLKAYPLRIGKTRPERINKTNIKELKSALQRYRFKLNNYTAKRKFERQLPHCLTPYFFRELSKREVRRDKEYERMSKQR